MFPCCSIPVQTLLPVPAPSRAYPSTPHPFLLPSHEIDRALLRIQAPLLQPSGQPVAVFLGADDHGGFAGPERRPYEAAQLVEEVLTFPVELDHMGGVIMVAPLRHGGEWYGVRMQSIAGTHFNG